MSDGNLTPLDYTQIQILLERIEKQNLDPILTPSEYAKIIREMIQNENDFVNQRLGWMSTFNGILFGAVYFVWKENVLLKDHTIPIAFICIAGLLIDFSIFTSLQASEDVRKALNNLWENKHISKTEIPPVWGWVACSKKDKKNRWLMPWFVMPVIFMVAWILILFFHVRFHITGD